VRDRIAAEPATYQFGNVGVHVGVAARQGKRTTFFVGSIAVKQRVARLKRPVMHMA
jgi:hypothetical protein